MTKNAPEKRQLAGIDADARTGDRGPELQSRRMVAQAFPSWPV